VNTNDPSGYKVEDHKNFADHF